MNRLTSKPWFQIALVVLTAATLFGIYAQRAWIAEDAHITLRTVNNFFDGYGLRWNVDERVQSFTHPLWLVLIVATYAVTREVYFTLAAMGLVFSVGAYVVVAWRFRAQPLLVVIGLFLPCATSVFLVRYSTSGLENSLTIFLLALFALLIFQDPDRDVPWGRLGLLTGLGMANRLDTLLLYLPTLIVLLARHRRSVAWGRLAAGFLPIAAWTAFSLVYYGFLLPNTAYAKLSSAIPRSTYIASGLRFLADPWLNDPISAAALLLGTAVTVLCWFASRHGDEGALRVAGLGSGALLYVLYAVWIGGDFMSGRFWVAPVFLMLVVIVGGFGYVADQAKRAAWWRLAATAVLLVALAFVFTDRAEAVRGQVRMTELPIRVELRWDDFSWERSEKAKHFLRGGLQARRRLEKGGAPTYPSIAIGIAGVAAGPDLKIIDKHGIGDPLMARLAPIKRKSYLPGHYLRVVPEGYEEARATGNLENMDPALAEYYNHLRLIVSGPLISGDRLATIIRFNLGQYDDLLGQYENRAKPAS